jgi:hypothetical protein
METTTNGGKVFTTETAPKGYTGPVRLTDEQKARRDESENLWLTTLVVAANDSSDPEFRDNARALLDARGVAW